MHHTPAKSIKYLAEINDRLSIKFNDASWPNDASDSVTCLLPNGRTIRIWFPNPNEGASCLKFAVSHMDEEKEEEETFLSYNGVEQMTLNQAVKTVKSYISLI